MTLSLAMIVKGGLDDLKRLQPLVKDYIDEWVVVLPPKDKAIKWAKENGLKVIVKDFTQPIEPEIREKMAGCGIQVPDDYRLFNFAAARNKALEECTSDYMLWLDADDTPVGLENMLKLINESQDVDVFYATYDYFRDEEGNSVSDHVRERVIRNNGKFIWKGAALGLIHETILPQRNYLPMEYEVPRQVFRVQHNSDHIDASSIRNHIALLYEYLKTDGEDPRTTYYLGIEYFNRGMYELCIQVLREYVTVGGSNEDKHLAYLKIAEAYTMLGNRDMARDAYFEAQKEMPNRPDSYLGIGETYFEEEEWAKCIEFMMMGLGKKMPKTKQAVDPIRYTFRPAGYIAQAMLQLGKPKEAFDWFVKTYKMNPKHPWVKEYAPMFKEAKELEEYVRAFIKLGQLSQKYPRTLSKLAEIIPDELMSQEILMDYKWRYSSPKIWSNKSIVFFCSEAFEEWGPESLVKGCGGSEEAVIQLTKRLVKLGWEVTVFNNCIKEGIVDGVKWQRFERFNPRDMFNVIVSWRNNLFQNYDITAAKKIIDMHDVPNLQHYQVEDVEGVQIFVKSNHHRGNLPDLPDSQFKVIPNGIDMSQFDGSDKVENSMVWTSSYDRGLYNLLVMWPDIRSEVPTASLDVYYGWELYDTTPWGKKPSGQAWKAQMQKLMQQDGIVDHGRVGTEEVAKAYNKADIWAYPTAFEEISCITAMKAQAAKAIPVSTDYAALKETVKGGIVIPGRGDDPQVLDKFKTELISLLKSTEKKKELREKLDASEFSWDNIAEQWNEAINEKI